MTSPGAGCIGPNTGRRRSCAPTSTEASPRCSSSSLLGHCQCGEALTMTCCTGCRTTPASFARAWSATERSLRRCSLGGAGTAHTTVSDGASQSIARCLHQRSTLASLGTGLSASRFGEPRDKSAPSWLMSARSMSRQVWRSILSIDTCIGLTRAKSTTASSSTTFGV